MSLKIMRQVWKLSLKPTQKLVLLALADNADDFGLCWPSRKIISDKTGLTEKAISTTLSDLKEAGFLTVDKLPGNRNQYQVVVTEGNHPVVTEGNNSSYPRSPLVVTEGNNSSYRGLLPNKRTVSETPKQPTTEPVTLTSDACDDVDLLESVCKPVDPWKDAKYGFDEFWSSYPKKVGKQDACKNWLKLKPTRETVDQIIANVKARLECGQWSLDRKKYIKDPERYISKRMWLDELIPNTQPSTQYSKPTFDDNGSTAQYADLIPWEDSPVGN